MKKAVEQFVLVFTYAVEFMMWVFIVLGVVQLVAQAFGVL